MHPCTCELDNLPSPPGDPQYLKQAEDKKNILSKGMCPEGTDLAVAKEFVDVFLPAYQKQLDLKKWGHTKRALLPLHEFLQSSLQ